MRIANIHIETKNETKTGHKNSTCPIALNSELKSRPYSVNFENWYAFSLILQYHVMCRTSRDFYNFRAL